MRAIPLAVILALPAGALAGAPAAPSPKKAELPGQEVELKTEDGWTLQGRYQPAGTANLTMVLLHGRGQRKELWIKLARALQREGFGYFAMDLRGHGQSAVGPDDQPAPWRKFKVTKTQNDYEGLARDLSAAVSWLTVQAVPEETIGFIGADVGGSIALKYAAVHAKAPLIALLSPGTRYQEITTVNAMRFYKNRPILMVYSEEDRFSSRDAPVLYGFAKMSAGERNATLISVPKIPGIRLPQNSGVVAQLIEWLKSPVKPETPAVSTPPAPGEPGAPGSLSPEPEPED